MPTDTPAGTRSRTAPSQLDREVPGPRSSASSTAISSAALAIRCPLTGASVGPTRSAVCVDARNSIGSRRSRITCRALATSSSECRGSALAPHSPHPLAPSPVVTRTSRMSRSLATPNGTITGNRTRRSSTSSTFIPIPHQPDPEPTSNNHGPWQGGCTSHTHAKHRLGVARPDTEYGGGMSEHDHAGVRRMIVEVEREAASYLTAGEGPVVLLLH